jgi:hypothetical protein
MKAWLAGVVTAAVAGGLAISPRAALADDAPPSAERLRSAASEYDAGRRAFGEKDYEGASVHFENAFHDAASASALRSAIRARRKAGELARAATLATQAQVLYPKDAPTVAVVKEILKEAKKKLERLTLRCTPDCGVAADGKAISTEDGSELIFYLEPGDHELVVSWTSDRNKTSVVTATAGADEAMLFEAPPVAPPPPPVVEAPPPPPPPSKPLPPLYFYSAAGLTLVFVGVTVWSGVDAENNPGAAAVRRDCVGLGASCPEYKQGLSAQLRTNALLGTTIGLAAATGVVGVFFTQWSRPSGESKPATAPQAGVVALPGGGGGLVVRGSF